MRFYNEAYLQFIAEFQYGELLVCGTPYWEILKSPHEPTVRYNIQPATQTTKFGDFQWNEADSSNRSTVPPAIFPLSSHEPTPPTSAIPTASTGTIVKAASLSSLPSIWKQETSDVRSSRPGCAKIKHLSIQGEIGKE